MSGTGVGNLAFAAGVIAALLTSFYSWRLIFLTFFGKARWAASEHIRHAVHDAHHGDVHNEPAQEDSGHETHPAERSPLEAPAGTGGYHPHESPWTMLVPLALLSLGAIFAGLIFHAPFIEAEEGAHFWGASLYFDTHLMHAIHEAPTLVKWSPAIVMLIGLAVAWLAYIRNPALAAATARRIRPLYLFLYHKWYFDELYHLIFVRPAMWLGGVFWKKGDEGTIDRFGPDGAAAVMVGGNRLTARLQSGYVYTYALVMLLGIAAAATWALAPR